MSGPNSQTNTGTYEPSGLMHEPPNVITTKDLAYLKDALSWELLAAKKCRAYAGACSNQEITRQMNGLGSMHQNQYERLLKYVQSDPNQAYLQ